MSATVDSGPPWPAVAVGDKLRRIAAARRCKCRRRILIGVTAIAAAPAALGAFWTAPVLLLWNASASAPIGLYRVEPHAQVRRGDMVIARTPAPVRALAAERDYIPASVPLVKRVAAAGGDRVCAGGRAVKINGRRVALRLRSDAAGRPMPWWNGCRTLGTHEFFLLTDNPQSFDGRYFGITNGRDLIGRAVLLWAEPAKGSSHA